MFINTGKTTQSFYGLDNTFRDHTIITSTEIRVIDFGSATETTNWCEGTRGTPGYQAPEIVMDHFAIGCIIAEMLTYKPLIPCFSGDREETMSFMDRILGPFPELMRHRIEKELPSPFGFDGVILNGRATLYLDIVKTAAERIEDPEAAHLIQVLTNLNASKRGNLKSMEKWRFLRSYEM
ncbi:kinase-like domain-containing protein [Mycena metata]|uniref:Kinase-like domain-containing protein n=1 Tax=Mycena metata TaxID=1033252 RepID=A0AAD7N8T4_9AGAR|nr:kinase-like domain-containing protein [Mycena metata]